MSDELTNENVTGEYIPPQRTPLEDSEMLTEWLGRADDLVALINELAPRLPRPDRWQWRIGVGYVERDSDEIEKVLHSALDNGNLDRECANLIGYAFCLARRHFTATCPRCKTLPAYRTTDQFFYLGRWLPTDPLAPAPALCDRCDQELTRERQQAFDKAADELKRWCEGNNVKWFRTVGDLLRAMRDEVLAGRREVADAISELDEKVTKAVREQRKRDRNSYIAENMPELYRREIERERLPNPAAFDSVQRWLHELKECECDDFPCIHRTNGLISVGPTGYAKTLSNARLIIDAFDSRDWGGEFDDFLLLAALDLKEAAHQKTDPNNDLSRSAKELIERARTTGALLLDDLQDAPFTASYAATLKMIVEYRTANGLPLFITTQVGGKALLNRVADKKDPVMLTTAQSILRRIDDFCRLVEF